MTKENKIGMKIAAGIVGGLLVGGLGVGFIADDSKQVDALKAKITDLENQPLPEAVVNEVEVEVDSENLEAVLDYVYDNNNNTYITEDLDDDEVYQIVDRIVFINEAKVLAANAVKALDIAEEIEDAVIDGENDDYDERLIERINVQDDLDDIKVIVSDFDDNDAVVNVTVDFEHDDIDYEAVFDVKIRDGEVDDIEVSSITNIIA